LILVLKDFRYPYSFSNGGKRKLKAELKKNLWLQSVSFGEIRKLLSDNLMNNENTFVIMPTWGWQITLYQLPAVVNGSNGYS